jgi:hypothetical protein
MTRHDRTTERNHGTVGCPGLGPGAGIVGRAGLEPATEGL